MRTARLPQPLPESERKLFEFIVNSCKHMDVCLRVAGGWVRDQMLNRPSDDIDICIETPQGKPYVSGEQLAQVVADATATHPTVSKIKTNPDKSKHIETGIVKVMGYHLEFCHLRKDDYTHCTPVQRTPTVTVASPLEDAQRRDFCCNALFYNLHTHLVEDFVGGLEDLQARRLRCPLAPLETFEDDPLRMLRGVRFAGRLGFELDQAIIDSIVRGGTQASAEILARQVSSSSAAAAAGTSGHQPAASTSRLHIDTGFADGAAAAAAAASSENGGEDDDGRRRSRSSNLSEHPDVNEPFFTHECAHVKLRPLAWELLRKVSRERCGIESGKMFSGPSPLACAQMLFRLQLLYSTVLIEMHPVKNRKPVAGAAPAHERIVMLLPPPAWAEGFRRTEPLLHAMERDDVGAKSGSPERLVLSLLAMITVPLLCPPPHAFPSSTSGGNSDAEDDAAAPHLTKKLVRNVVVPMSRREELAKRAEAIVQHGLKLPSTVAEQCGILITALDILLAQDVVVAGAADSEQQQQGDQPARPAAVSAVDLSRRAVAAAQRSAEDAGTTPAARIEGPLRDKIFFALRQAKQATHSGLAGMLTIFAGLAFEGDAAAAAFFVRSVMADELLWRSGTMAPAIKGDALLEPTVLPGMPPNRTSDVLSAQLQFMVNNAGCSLDQITAFLRATFPDFAAPRAQQAPSPAAKAGKKKGSSGSATPSRQQSEGGVSASAAAAATATDPQRVESN